MLVVRYLVPVTDRSRHHPLFFAQIRGSAAPTCSQHHSIMHMTCACWYVMDGMPMHASRGDTGNDDLHMQRTLDDHGMRHF